MSVQTTQNVDTSTAGEESPGAGAVAKPKDADASKGNPSAVDADGGGSEGVDYWKAQVRKAAKERDDAKAKAQTEADRTRKILEAAGLAEPKEVDTRVELKKLRDENRQLQAEVRRDRVMHGVLSNVPADHHKAITRDLLGMAAAGEIDFNADDSASQAGEALRLLREEHPHYFVPKIKTDPEPKKPETRVVGGKVSIPDPAKNGQAGGEPKWHPSIHNSKGERVI